MMVLDGIKIIELVHSPPGELCGMILGDLGADIVKVEPASQGKFLDLHGDSDADTLKASMAHNALNRNKKSIKINLKSEGGRKIFHRLAKNADVIIEGFRPGVAKRLSVDYASIQCINPRIVYCSLSGYGQDGPYSQVPGHDINFISIAGALNLIGQPGQPPAIPLSFLADFAGASLHGALGILAALFAREHSGKGQYVDISFTDTVITMMTFFLQQYFGGGSKFPRGEWALGGGYPYYNTYETGDGKLISLGCVEPWFWTNLCKAIGREDLQRFGFRPAHLSGTPGQEWQEVRQILTTIFRTKTRDEWFDLLIQRDVPVGKVYSIDEIFTDPQLLHRHMLLELDHPRLGKVKQPGIAIKLSETPGEVRTFAPYPGENTDEVLQSLGYSKPEIEDLRRFSTIG
jgi:crotonobetainyl-CoA:carnitine CoA-transferase CaiB-like acyl-CoA transferase